MTDSSKVQLSGQRAWLITAGLSVALFAVWLAAGGPGWEGYPCFTWSAPAAVRLGFFAALVAAVGVFVNQLWKVVCEPQRFTPAAILLAFIAFISLRIVIASAIPLISDEAYHWLWPEQIDWCYYDHPGMLGWVTWPFYQLSDTLMMARMGPIVMGTIAALLVWRFAAWLSSDENVAKVTLAALMAIPVGLLGTTIVFTDAPLAVFWVLAVWIALIAARRDRLGWWVLLGVCWGMAADCKFLAVPLIVFTFAWWLTEPVSRRALVRPGPYIALALALIVFLPTLLWNAANGWQTFVFHFVRREPVSGLYPSGMLIYLGRQVLLAGPALLAWCLIYPWLEGRRQRRQGCPSGMLLVWTGYVPFMIYVVMRILRPVEPGGGNWTAPLYALMVILLAWAGLQAGRSARRWLLASAWAGAATSFVLVIAVVGQSFIGPKATGDIFGLFRSEGHVKQYLRYYFHWYPLGREVDLLYERYRGDGALFVMARNYAQASNLSYYCRSTPLVLSMGDDSIFGQCFVYWNEPQGREGQNCLFVSDHPPSKYVLDILYRCFESVHRLGEDERAIQNFVAGYGEIFYCKGLREFPLATMREALPR
ncbi:MAG: glycosyltransferase family 39 protein [Phycisphaerae bacterium]|nr:glycosyltransferase family 39 protein [Phycisphaerae bacterium]